MTIVTIRRVPARRGADSSQVEQLERVLQAGRLSQPGEWLHLYRHRVLQPRMCVAESHRRRTGPRVSGRILFVGGLDTCGFRSSR